MHVEREDEQGNSHELTIEVSGRCEPYVPARLNGHPDTWSPAEGGDVEIEEVVCKNEALKYLFKDLTPEEREEAEELIRDDEGCYDDEEDEDDDYDYGLYTD